VVSTPVSRAIPIAIRANWQTIKAFFPIAPNAPERAVLRFFGVLASRVPFVVNAQRDALQTHCALCAA